MSRLALSSFRTALSRPARPSPALPRSLALTSRASTRGKKSQSQSQPASVYVPPESFFEKFAQWLKLKEGNPNEYFRCVSEWLRAHRLKKTDDPNLLKKIKLPLQTFHQAAVFLQMGRFNFPRDVPIPGAPTDIFHPFTLPMLRYASEQGHAASTITYLELELQADDVDARPAELPKDLRTRLDAIVATDRHPDALIVAARLAVRDGNDPLAESLAWRALKLNRGDDSLPLEWGATAHVLLGQIAFRRGDTAEARRLFITAVERHDSLHARMELAYDGECPGHVARLSNFATMGGRHDCLEMSQGESDFAAKMLERGDKQRFLDHQYMAQEWLRLAKTKKEDLRA